LKILETKPHGLLVPVSSRVTAFTLPAYQPGRLPGPFRGLAAREFLSRGRLHAYMPSAFIRSQHSYPAMPLARQQVH